MGSMGRHKLLVAHACIGIQLAWVSSSPLHTVSSDTCCSAAGTPRRDGRTCSLHPCGGIAACTDSTADFNLLGLHCNCSMISCDRPTAERIHDRPTTDMESINTCLCRFRTYLNCSITIFNNQFWTRYFFILCYLLLHFPSCLNIILTATNKQ